MKVAQTIAGAAGFLFYMAGMACWAFLFSIVFGRV